MTPATQALYTQLTTAKRFPQTLLLSGEAGSELGALATALAGFLLCNGANRPCGVCPACRKFAHGAHTDYTVINEGEGDIKLDLARSLRSLVAVIPNEGERRVFVVHHAERLNLPSQNALLKTLEEPPAYAYFILLSEAPQKLLATIRSRASIYHLTPLKEETVDVASLDALRPLLCALAQADEFAFLKACTVLEKLDRSGRANLFTLFRCALRDTLCVLDGVDACLLPNLQAETTALARIFTQKQLFQLSDVVYTLSKRIETNASPLALGGVLCASAFSILSNPSFALERSNV